MGVRVWNGARACVRVRGRVCVRARACIEHWMLSIECSAKYPIWHSTVPHPVLFLAPCLPQPLSLTFPVSGPGSSSLSYLAERSCTQHNPPRCTSPCSSTCPCPLPPGLHSGSSSACRPPSGGCGNCPPCWCTQKQTSAHTHVKACVHKDAAWPLCVASWSTVNSTHAGESMQVGRRMKVSRPEGRWGAALSLMRQD